MKETRYYFGYGSNLNPDDWNLRNPDGPGFADVLEYVGAAWLPDAEVAFTAKSQGRRGGVLDVRDRIGSLVPGAIFRVHGEQGWRALDRKEGAPAFYERVDRVALGVDGREIPVTTYTVTPDRRHRFVKPHEDYVRAVIAGLRDRGLPDEHVLAAAENRGGGSGPGCVFVYGTLMRGEALHETIEECHPESILLAETRGRLVDLGGIPALLRGPEHDGRVRGELVVCRDFEALLRRLDRVEGFRGFGSPDNMYRRIVTGVGMMDGHERQAWTYVYARPAEGATPIPSGDWREHRGTRRQALEAIVRARCGRGERRVAKALVDQFPGRPRDARAAMARLLPLAGAPERGDISERELVMAVEGPMRSGCGPSRPRTIRSAARKAKR